MESQVGDAIWQAWVYICVSVNGVVIFPLAGFSRITALFHCIWQPHLFDWMWLVTCLACDRSLTFLHKVLYWVKLIHSYWLIFLSGTHMWFLHMSILFEDGSGWDLLVMDMMGGFSLQVILVLWLCFWILCDRMWVSRFAQYVESGNSLQWLILAGFLFSVFLRHRFLVNRH